jgi:hypothetical protein
MSQKNDYYPKNFVFSTSKTKFLLCVLIFCATHFVNLCVLSAKITLCLLCGKIKETVYRFYLSVRNMSKKIKTVERYEISPPFFL